MIDFIDKIKTLIKPKEVYMITREEILMGRDKAAPLTPEMEKNLEKLLVAINKFRAIYGKPMTITSGYRPPNINANTPGAAKKSNHMVCLAVDFKDADGSLDAFCMNNLAVLEKCGLWLESSEHTPGWCHLQCVPPASGKRVFNI